MTKRRDSHPPEQPTHPTPAMGVPMPQGAGQSFQFIVNPTATSSSASAAPAQPPALSVVPAQPGARDPAAPELVLDALSGAWRAAVAFFWRGRAGAILSIGMAVGGSGTLVIYAVKPPPVSQAQHEADMKAVAAKQESQNKRLADLESYNAAERQRLEEEARQQHQQETERAAAAGALAEQLKGISRRLDEMATAQQHVADRIDRYMGRSR